MNLSHWARTVSFLLGLGSVACATSARDSRSTPLPTTTLAQQGLSGEAWDQAIAEIHERELPIDSMIVVVGGTVVAEHHRRGYDRTRLHDLRSSTKSITSLLVGMAIDRGLLRLDQDITASFPDYAPDPSWATQPPITVEDLLTMHAGLDCDDRDRRSPGNEEKMYRSRDWLAFFFAIPAREAPEGRIRYCTAGVVVLGEMVARAAETPLDELAARWLFEPLEIAEARWQPARGAAIDAGGHLELSIDSFAKVALLVQAGGRHDGESLISPDYLAAMLTPHSPVYGPEAGPHYGYLWWLEPVEDGVVRSYQTRGNGGQFAIVLPSLDAVVAFTGHGYNDMPRAMGAFEVTARHLIPMLSARSGLLEDQHEARRLTDDRRIEDRDLAGVFEALEHVAAVDQAQAVGLPVAHGEVAIDAMELLGRARAGAGLGVVIDDHQAAAALEAGDELIHHRAGVEGRPAVLGVGEVEVVVGVDQQDGGEGAGVEAEVVELAVPPL